MACLAYLLQSGSPFSTLGVSETGRDEYASLDLDFTDAGHVGIAHLLALRHPRTATVDTTEKLNYRTAFAQGCARAFAAAGAAPDASLQVGAEPTEQAGKMGRKRCLPGATRRRRQCISR